MRLFLHYRWWTAAWLLTSWLLHSTFQYQTFSYVPLWLTIPVALPWTTDRPLKWLALWATIAELASTLPVGLMIAVSLTPWIVRRIFRSVTVDLSAVFLAILLLTTLASVSWVYGYEVATLSIGESRSLNETLATIPGPLLLLSVVLSSLFNYGVCLLSQQLKPYEPPSFARTW